MTQPPQSKKGEGKCLSPKAAILRQEFVALTQEPLIAIVLNQLLYWTQRVKDFDLHLQEEQFFNQGCNVSPRHGWIYKTANDLIEETMICVDRTTMRRYLKFLMDKGWLEERSHPKNKWDKTSQYRLNLRKLQEDLLPLGFELPGIELLLQKEFIHKSDAEELISEPSEMAELSNGQIAPSKGNFTPSSGDIAPSEEQNAPSNVTNSPLYIQRLQSENKNKEHTQRTGVHENFSDLENLENSSSEESVSSKSVPDESVAEEMIRHWEYHVVQKVFPTNWEGTLHLTVIRKDQLESLFAFHFQNDIRLWEQFCLRVKASFFLMGGGPNGWKVTLDWVLLDRNLLKILEGNYDNLGRAEQQGSDEWDLAKIQPNPVRDAEKAAIIAAIKDPIWKNWCSQLAIGVRLNDLQMVQPPLSLSELKEIANARFLECEDERLVWIGSEEPSVLNNIDNLRLKINWVFKNEYPKAHTMRTRLLEENFSLNAPSLNEVPLEQGTLCSSSLSTKPTQQQGDIANV